MTIIDKIIKISRKGKIWKKISQGFVINMKSHSYEIYNCLNEEWEIVDSRSTTVKRLTQHNGLKSDLLCI